MENSRFTNFRLGKLLGRGAFGHVYETYLETDPNTKFAIKIIDKKAASKRGVVDRILSEVQIHRGLRHSNVLSMYTFHEDDDYFYLLTEICSKGELYHHLKDEIRRPLSEMECHWYMLGLVSGIQYLHSNGIIHRDLKLSNILISDKYEVKIADFGLAVYSQDIGSNEELTLCGTPNYLSPEVLAKESCGFAADMWSLGVIVYTLLIGRPPFEGSSVKDTFSKIMGEEPYIPTIISQEAQDLIRGLLRKNPQNRLVMKRVLEHPFLTRYRINIGVCKNLENIRVSGNPLVYNTRIGRLSISDGTLEFQIKGGLDRIRIHGSTITIERKGKRLYFKEDYPIQNLPVPLISIYRLVYKLFDEIKQRTVRIILETLNVKCSFMFNEPYPNCKMEFKIPRGIVCVYYPQRLSVLITKSSETAQKSCSVDLNTMDTRPELYSSKIAKLMNHVRYYYSLYNELNLDKASSFDLSSPPTVHRYEKLSKTNVSEFKSTSTINWNEQNQKSSDTDQIIRCVIEDLGNLFYVYYQDLSILIVDPVGQSLCLVDEKTKGEWKKIDQNLNNRTKEKLKCFYHYVKDRFNCG